MNLQSTGLAWGETTLQWGEWHTLGQLWLNISRGNGEYTFSHAYGKPTRHGWLQFTNLTESRLPVDDDLGAFQLLSNRPVVARPNLPLKIPPGTNVTLYVGTSLWFCLKRDKDVLLDIPVMALSDTWFGPDRVTGEVCYACDTHARLSMQNARINPAKAITPIEIVNDSSEVLTGDRVNLPIPNVTLYKGSDRHWTSKITITRNLSDSASEVRVASEPPPECPNPVEVATPRSPVAGGMLTKAMNLLWG